MQFLFSHEFDTTPEGFWAVFWDEEYNKALYQALAIRSRTVLKDEQSGGVRRRSQRLEPSVPVPGWASSVLKDLSYTEHDTFHPERSSMDVQIEPVLGKDRFQMSGVFSVTPSGNGRCRRDFKGEVKISVPLLGGKLEKLMMEQLREAYDQAAAVTRDFIRKRQAPAS